MRKSKLTRKLARAIAVRPWTRHELEGFRQDTAQAGIWSNTFAGGVVSPYAKKEPKEPTGREFPLSMFVKNDTTQRLAQAKERRQMIRGKV